jgi:hypothetical protein
MRQNMIYVLWNMDEKRYVAPLGEVHSFTRYLTKARRFTSKEAAEAERCSNERIHSYELGDTTK